MAVLTIAGSIVVKSGWHLPLCTPAIHAVRAAGGKVSIATRSNEWVRALLGEDFGAEICAIELDNTRLTDDRAARLLRPFASVTSLRVGAGRFNLATPQVLSQFTQLEDVNFQGTEVSRLLLESLQNCPNLTWIGLFKATVDRDALAGVRKLPNVERLFIVESSLANHQLADLGLAPHLISICLERCAMVSDEGLSELAQQTKLQLINVNHTSVTGAAIKHLSALPNLQSLELRATPLSDDALIDCAALVALRHLNLSDTPVSNRGVEHLQPLTQLASLNLSGTGVTDEAAASLQKMTGLYILRLSRTAITDRTVVALASQPQLINLALDQTQITDAIVAPLEAARLAGTTRLQELSISNGKLSEPDVERLEKVGIRVVLCD